MITCMYFKSIQRLPEIHEICRHHQRFRMMNILRVPRNSALIFNAINLIFRRTSAGFRGKALFVSDLFSYCYDLLKVTVFRLYDIMHSKTTAGKIGYLRQIKKPNPEHHVRQDSARSEVLTKNIRYKREPRAIQKMGAPSTNCISGLSFAFGA